MSNSTAEMAEPQLNGGAILMDIQVDIYQCGSSHIHVILRGQVQGEAVFGDFDLFAHFIEVCQDFINNRKPIPKVFLDAFDDICNI